MDTVLFDLDGTLLPMDQELFTKAYFDAVAEHFAGMGIQPKPVLTAVYAGTMAMVKNDGARTNEKIFWETFTPLCGDLDDKFDDFYKLKFDGLKSTCGHNAQAAATIAHLKAKGINVVLASNPIFPLTAQKKRMQWAGVDPDDFCYITSYENSRYCKPNVKYYEEILNYIGKRPSDCVMVGNDTIEDEAAHNTGMRIFLMTDCLINRNGKDISKYPHGSFDELNKFLSLQ